MSFLEMTEALNTAKQSSQESEAPVPGKAIFKSTNIEEPKKNLKKVVRYYVGNMDDPTEREFIADIMTKSLESSLTQKEEVGNIYLIREDSNWSKEGFYLVAIKYIEVVET